MADASGWLEFGKLVGAVASGSILVWLREWFAERRERLRKQEALWRACAAESETAENDLEQLKWLRDMVERGNCPMSIAAVDTAGSAIAQRLIELDPPRIEAYLSFIVRTAQLNQKANDLRRELAAYASAPDGQLMLRRLPMVGAELRHTARILQRQSTSRLRVLRVLRNSVPSDHAGQVISRAESSDRSIEAYVDSWENAYAGEVGLEKDLEDLRNIRPRS